MKTVGRLFYVLAGMVLISTGLFAQISPAGMSRAVIPFSWIEISDGDEIGLPGDDDEFYPVNFPSGFNFRYYNQPFNTVYVSSNGYLTFNNYGPTDPYPVNDNLSTTASPDSMLAVFWDDLLLSGDARIYSKVVGASPYRKLIIEYKDVTLKAGSFPMTFQVILYETTNLIQFQYLELSGEQGDSATVGVKFFPDNLLYSFNNPSLSNNLAILFFPYASLAANSSIQPGQVSVGSNGQNFQVSVTNLTTGASLLQQMGKADVLRIKNPLSNPVAAVDSISVDGTDFFFIQRNTPPAVSEYTTLPTIATWYFDIAKDSLFIRLPPYIAKSEISVSFRMNIPNDPLGGYNFDAHIYPRLNFANATPPLTNAVNLVAGTITHYTIAPQNPPPITAGGSIQFTVTARDQFNNPVANDDSTTNSVLGSITALVSPTVGHFNNNSSFNFVVTETTAGTFVARTVNQNNSALSVQSGIVTVNPGFPTMITKVSGDSSGVIAGANQILQAKVTDNNGNGVSGVLVEFLIAGGGGNFSGFSTRTVSTDIDGIARATLTTGKTVGTNLANARIVISPGVSTQFNVTTVHGPISYYTVTPATFNTTVGTNVSVAVAAFDANNNPVTTDNSTMVEFLSDGSGVTITPGSATLVGGTTNFTVSNTAAETFRVQARSQLDHSKTGFSGSITTNAGAPATLVKIAGDGQTAPINTQLPLDLEVQVLDQFSNPVSGATVTFDPIGGGSAGSPSAISDSLGIVSSSWTVHSTATPDSMEAYISGQDTVLFTANVVAGSGVVMTQLAPTTSSGVVDNFIPDNFGVKITDSGGNVVPNFQVSFAIVSKPAGTANDSLTVYSGTTDAQGEVETNLHLGTKAGTYMVRAFSASTTPNFVDFTATAFHGDPDRILVSSGNNQTGTVGQPLSNPIQFQLVDPYDNPIPDSTLDFRALNGIANPVFDITNVSGQAATTWTLGDTAGIQKMVADFTPLGIISDTAYATALPAAGDSLVLISMRQIVEQDSIAALRGENITVVVRAFDAFDNPAPNTLVNFDSLPGFNVQFQDAQVTTDAQGRAVNIVTTDQGNDSTFFRAFISGSDTLDLHIFHIRYAGNLSPAAVSPGETVAFSLDLENLSPNPVELNAGATRFRFSDGTNLFDATLNTPVTLPPGTTNVTFNAAIVDTNFANVNYAPEVFLRGSGENGLLGGSIFLPNNSLSIFTVRVSRILGSKTLAAQGDTLTITMRVRKSGPVTVNVDSVSLAITGNPQIPQANITPSPANPTQLAPGISLHDFEFEVIIPQNASGAYTVDGQFQGTTLSGATANDSGADTTFIFSVTVTTQLGLQSLSPGVVTSGQAVTFTATLFNDGLDDVLLNPNFTYLKFGSDSIPLKQSYSVPAGGLPNAVEVEFVTPSILSPAQLAPHVADVRLFGTQSGINFDTTLVGAESILVQNPPNLIVSLINVLPDTVSQNQDSILAQVQLTNSGALNAPARISLPGGMTLSTLGLDSIPAPGSGSFILNAGDVSAPVDFLFNLSPTYPPGNDRAKVRYRFSDVNSGTIYTAAPADSDQFVVLSRAMLSLQGFSLAPDTVSPGQSGVTFSVTVRNDGQSPAAIDSNDISIQFNNNHTIELISPAPGTLPVVLGQNVTQDFIYDITIDPASSIGPDPLDLTVSHSDTFSGKGYTDVVENNLDTLEIFQKAGPAEVQIQTVELSPATANQGQSGMQATVRLKNLSQSPVRIDSLNLIYSRPGLSGSLLTSLPRQIPGGDTLSFQFTLSAGAAMPPGAVTVDAGYQATELLFGSTFSDSGAVSPGLLTILLPANFSFTPLTLEPDSVTQGQSGIIASTIISNGDSTTSPARVSGLQALYSVGGVVNDTLINPPSLPALLPGGESLQVQFRLNISGSAAPGTVDVQIAADALDLTDGTTFSDTSQTAVLTIQQRAQLGVQSISPAAVTTGEAAAFSAFLFNNGADDVLLNPSSFLKFGLDSILLKQSYSVPVGDTVEVAFVTSPVLSPAQAAPHLADLRLLGTQSGIGFDTTLTAAGSILVQNPPNLIVSVINVLPDTTAQNQDSIMAQVQLTNSGALNAPARISLPGGMTLSTLGLDSIPASGGGSFTLNAGEVSAPVDFLFNLSPTYPPGNDRAKVRYRFSDVNSGTIYTAAPADSDLFVVLPRARLSLQGHTLSPDTVSQGQSGVEFRFTLRNDGQSPAAIDSGDISIQFNNPHTINLVSPAPGTLPMVLGENASQEFIYNITINPVSSIGPDPLDLAVSHTDTLSGKGYTDVIANNLDTLLIVQGTGAAEVQIQTVQISPASANQGQSGMLATVRVKNSSQITVRIDSLHLGYSRPGISDSLLTLLPGQIAGGATANFQFTLSADDTISPGTVTVDAAYQATELQFGVTFSDSGAVSPGTLTILTPANFSFTPLTLEPDSVTQGQGGIIASTIISNGDSTTSPARITGLQALFSVGGVVNDTLINPPSLPALLPGGESLQVQFRLNVSGSAPAGTVDVQIAADALDLTDGSSFSDTSQTAVLTIQQRAQLGVQSISPAAVTTGEAATFSAVLFNNGADDVLLDANSYLKFGLDSILLKQSYSVPAGGLPNAVEVEFFSSPILSPAQASPHLADLRLLGTQSGINFDTTLTAADSILVQNPPNVIVSLINVLPDTVVQNQDSIMAQVQLTNSGALNAPASISLPGGMTLSTLGLDSIPASGGGSFTLNAGEVSAPVDFLYNLSPTYPPGNDRAKVRYRFTDVNSGTIYTAAPADSDLFVVLPRARLSLQGHSLAPDTVSPGQSGVEFRFTLRNDGQSPAAIDSSNNISIQFNNNHTIELVSPDPGALPVILGETAEQEFTYHITIDPASSIGPDPLDLTVSHRDILSGKSYTDVVENNLDTLRIIQGTGAADVQIQTVQISPATANQGQSGMLATVRLKNLSQATVRIDSLNLIYSRPGISGSLLTTLPRQIPGGDTLSFQFTLSADAAMPVGAVTVDAGYEATELLFNNTFSDSGAVSPGNLTILFPANFSFTPLTLEPDTATQGQGGIIATTVISNGNDTTSSARVTGLQALFSVGGGVVSGTLINPLSLPVLLAGGESLQVQFRLNVSGSAPAGTVDVQIAADALDLTDGSTFSDTSLTAVLTIQQKANLEIVSLVIPPDSAFLGQTEIPVNITVQNSGGGTAQLNKVNLVLHNAPSFPQSLLTFDLPEILSQGQQKEVNYQISIPSNINLPGGDSLIYAGANLEGTDVSSGAPLFNSADSIDNLLIAEPPDIRFDGLLSSSVWGIGDTANFKVEVTNTGGTNLTLNTNTFLKLEQTGNPSNFFIRPINPDSTNMNILAGETTQLIFRDTVLAGAGDYRLSLGIRANIYQPPNQLAYSQDILTQAFLNVGGNISVQFVQVVPDEVQPGDIGIQVNAIVENNTLPVVIDPGWVLEFRYTDNSEPLTIVPTRLDTLTQVGTTPAPDTLKWLFNVPGSARAGEVGVTVSLTFGNGTIPAMPRTGFFDIKSGADVDYIVNSLTPAEVVPGQQISFSAKFINKGSENYFVTAGSSYLEFSDGVSQTFRSFVNGNFVVGGTGFGQTPDTSIIAFSLDSLSSQFLTGNYDVSFYLFGDLPNGDTLTALDTTFANQVTVLPEALVTVDSVDIVPNAVVPGQDSVRARYFIRNSGASAATIQSASSIFTDSLGANISALWTVQNQPQTFPFTLGASGSTILTRTFIVSQNIDSGLVRGRLQVHYNDVRKPQTPRVADDPAVYDSVKVITPSRIFVDGLELVNVPNAANRTVNYSQPYDLQLTLQNSGRDSLTNIIVRLFNDANQSIVLTDTMTGTILEPEMQFQKLYPRVAGNISETVRYRAVILQAVSVTSGTAVQIGEPLDNREDVTVQQPIELTLNVEASGDSAYTQGQEFTVSFNIDTTGQSPFGEGQLQIVAPPGYNLVAPVPWIAIGPTNLSGSWQVIASQDTTVGDPDTIRVFYSNIPPDLNTNAPVITTNDNVTVPVQVVEGGSVSVTSIDIVSPPGALDSTVSSGQLFRLGADIQYRGSVAAAGRSASLTLPAGFFTADSIEQTIQGSGATIFWNITVSENILQTLASNSPGGRNDLTQTAASGAGRGLNRETGTLPPGVLESLLAQDFQIEVTAKGVDKGNNTPFSGTRGKQVTVVERAEMVMQSEIVAPFGGTVSTYLPFDVQIRVEKLGEAGVFAGDSNYVMVKVPQGFTIDGLTPGDSLNHAIKTGETDTIRIFAPPSVPVTQPLILARIDSAARDENTNAPAFIRQAVGSFNVAVVRRAALRIDSLSAGVDSLGQNQPFTLQGLLSNTGQANVEPDDSVTVYLDFDTTAFQLKNPGDTVKTIQLVNNPTVISWEMETKDDADTTTNPYFISASIDSTLSWDEHGDSTIAVHLEKGEVSDTLNIVSTGSFSIASTYLDSTGIDSLTVSTNQAVQVVMIPQISGLFENRVATLDLPNIFPGDSMVAAIPAGGDPVVFNIQIPDTVSNLWEELRVRIRGTSQINPNVIRSDTAYLYIFVEKRASLVMQSAIVAPPGATSGTVSTYLPFDVKIWVVNQGVAGLFAGDSNYVTVKVPQGFTIDGLTPGDSLNHAVKTGEVEADTIRIFAPPTVPVTQPLILARIDSAARDENTNAPAFIQEPVASFNVAVVRRAALRIDSLSAGVDSLGQNQAFTLQGLLRNTGQANVEPDDSVTVRLDFDTTAFQLQNAGDTVKTIQLVNNPTVISWQMRTKPDANINTNPYFISASIDSTLSWDEYGDSTIAVHLEKGEAGDTLNIVSTGTFSIASAYLNTPGTDSLTVSTAQGVAVTVEPQISGSFINRFAVLYLPDIFPGDSMIAPIPAGGSPVTFNIQIPDTVTGVWEELMVKIQGTSQISNTVTLRDTAYLHILVQTRTTLVISGQIIGAGLNNTVSQGSSFIYEAQVNNTGQAGVLSTPRGQLTFETGDKLNVHPDSLVKNFNIGQPIHWTVDVEENVLAGSLLRQIQSLKNEKTRLVVAQKRSASPEGRQTSTARFAKTSPENTTRGISETREAEQQETKQREAEQREVEQRELEQLEGQISGLYQQLSAIVDTSFVKATITTAPHDTNSGKPALVQTGSDSITVLIAEKPTIEIIAFTPPFTWSTEQQGIVEVTVDAPGNVIDRTGILRLPEGLSFVNPADSLKTFTQNTMVNWAIQADQTISAPSLSGTLTVIVLGRDENNPPPNIVEVRDTTEIPVTIERKALLKLSSPGISIRLRKAEEFTVTAIVENQGTANVSGSGGLRLNIGEEFEFAPGETAEKEFTINNATNTDSVEWNIIAPDFEVNTIFGIGFFQRPDDINTQNPASVVADTLVIDVNMIPSRVIVKQLPGIQVENSYVQGESEVPVVGLGFSNPNSAERIILKGFSIGIVEGESDAPVADMQNLVSRVEVVSYDFYRGLLAKGNAPPDRLGEILIDAQTSNPFTLNFAFPDTVSGEQTDSLLIWIDLADQPVNRNFKVRLSDIEATGLSDERVNVVDSLGSPIEALAIQSPRITILSSDPEEIFRNYPNPFSMDTQLPGAPRGVTRFSFKMESSGDAELRIFTLMGRLVRSTELQNVPEGLHNNLLSWDGTNGQGDRVVNGVYIAVLQVRYSNGGTETYETKVAYIK